MSAFDVTMQKYTSNLLIIGLILLIITYVAKRFLRRFRDKMFAKFESAFADIYNGESKLTKQKLFAPLHEIVSSDWNLKNKGLIRILEIGCGNGANLKYFPKNCHLVMVDPNSFYEPLLHDNLRRYPSLNLEQMLHCKAEDMSAIPDGSVDAVVATLVLCSVTDVARVLAEIHRVLAPGGKFIFLEHVLAEPGSTLNKIQRALSQSGLWPTLMCGCYLDRETGRSIKQAGFSSLQIEYLEVFSENYVVFKLIRSHVAGIATK